MFSRLTKLFETNCHDTGNILEHADIWEVSPLRDSTGFFLALRQLLPAGCILCLEAPLHAQLRQFLASHPASCNMMVVAGTEWPKPAWYHVEASTENLERIEEVTRRDCAEPEICTHLIVYKDSQILLSWYDAWLDPMELSSCFAESEVRDFCGRLGTTYKRARR
jgi:hypothetical protein